MILGARDRRDRTALGTSIAVHALALGALALLPRSVPPGDEAAVGALAIRLEHRAVATAPPRVVRPRRNVPPAVVAVAAAPRVAPGAAVRPLALPRAGTHPEPALHGAPLHVRASHEPVIAAAVPASAAPAAVATSAPVATAAPSSEPVATPTPPAARAPLGAGPFSADYAPELLPAGAIAQMRSQLGGRVAIRVQVDDAGRATDVIFLRFPNDAAARDALRAQLLAARYLPAECNGLACAGTLEIRT